METLQTPYGRVTIYLNHLPEENSFHVSFVDKSNKTHTILMHYDGSRWVFSSTEHVPHWFVSFEAELNHLITKECISSYRPSFKRSEEVMR